MSLKKNHKKIILDTNIWISFSIGKKLTHLKEILLNESLSFYFCDELVLEYQTVISRPKFKKYVSKNRVEETLSIMHDVCIKKTIHSEVLISRDINDNFLLALSKDTKADFLVTGDNDLLILRQFEKTKIISFSTLIASI